MTNTKPFGHGMPDIEPDIIAIWPYSVSTIPEGWVLCDGNNGTPNLMDRYTKGISSASETPGSTGGSTYWWMTTAQMPSHSHNASVGNSGSHEQYVGDRVTTGRSSTYSNTNSVRFYKDGESTYAMRSAGEHSHAGETFSRGGTNHGVDNRPRSLEMFYIMKL